MLVKRPVDASALVTTVQSAVRDRRRRIGRYHPHPPLHLSQGGLHIQHLLKISGLIEDRAHRVATIQSAQYGTVGGVGGHWVDLLKTGGGL